MKVGIVTFQETNNYGAILQNYALQQALKKLGAEAETIDYRSEYIGKPYRLAHLKNKGLATYLFGVVGYLVYELRRSKNNSFRNHIRYSKPVKAAELTQLNSMYDKFITGSDQVFNHKLTGMDDTYMLGFVADKSKCSSYAASLGLDKIEPEYKEIYQKLLGNYHCITVREKTAANVLQDVLVREVYDVADPCILLTREEWESVAVLPKIKDKYVFVYELAMSKDVVALAERIAKEQNIKIIFAPFPMGKMTKGKWELTAGAGEIIGLIRNAEYIVTDSFHGTVFSILFNKPFFSKIADKKIGSRIKDLLVYCGLETRLLAPDIDYRESINYEEVNYILEEYRASSMKMLEKCIQ